MKLATRLLTLLLLVVLAAPLAVAELKPKTVAAFDQYVKATEAKIDSELKSGPYLWLDSLPDGKRQELYGRVRNGEVVMERLKTVDLEVPDGLIHHWVGVVFIPGASLNDVVRLMQDYDHHEAIYKPEVVKAKLLARNGNDFRVYMRVFKKKVISVYMDTEHAARYVPLSKTRMYSWSHSTQINEIENAGTAQEKKKPAGDDNGFMWRLNAYWRLEQKDGGVYVQCEAISLTRDIPMGVKWLVGPFVTSIPRESLEHTLGATRNAVKTLSSVPAQRSGS